MRPVVVRSVLLLGAAALAVTSGAAHAATPVVTPAKTTPVVITDPAGDANAINGEGLAAVPSVSTGPANDAGADILSISWQTLVTSKKIQNKTLNTPAGLQVVMKLSAAPQSNTIYRVTGGTAECSTFWFTYSALAGGKPTATLVHNCPGFTASGATSTTESDPIDSVKTAGSTITWTVPTSVLPKAFKPGVALTGLSGHARFYAGTSVTGGATVPLLDEAAGPNVFIYGK